MFRHPRITRRTFSSSLLFSSAAGISGTTWASAQAKETSDSVSPERFGYTGTDLAADTKAFNTALIAATGRTLVLRSGANYRVGRVSIANSVKIEGNGATVNLTGAGAGLYHDKSYDKFEVHDLSIIGDNNEASAQYALVFRGSSIKVGKGTIRDVRTRMCRQGIETSGFVLCDTSNTQNDFMLGTGPGRGYGQVMGAGAGTLDPTHKHVYVNVGGYRNARHTLYLGSFGNVTVSGVNVVEHAYGQNGQNHHAAVSVARGANAVLRDVRLTRCSDEAIAIDDDDTASGHANNIDVEFVTTNPQNDCVACRIGADGAIPGANVGVDRVRVSGKIELNPRNTVRDVQVFAATNVHLDLNLDGAKNYTGGDRKVVVSVFGDSRPAYFGNLDIRLAGNVTGSSEIYAIGFYKDAAQGDGSIRVENRVRGCRDGAYFDAAPHAKNLLVTRE